jgi:hypothetical protein
MSTRVQIVKSTRGSSQYLFEKEEPTVASGAVLDREVNWGSFAGNTSGFVEYRVVYRFENSGGEYQTIDFPIEPRQQRSLQATVVTAPPMVDGDLSDWSGMKWQSLSDRMQVTNGVDAWQGPSDLSAQFSISEDKENLYIAVRVVDDVVTLRGTSSRGGGGFGDTVELYAADANEKAITFSREPDWRRLVVAPVASGSPDGGESSGPTRVYRVGQRNIWGSEGGTQEYSEGRAAFKRDSNQYTLEIALTRAGLGWDDPTDRTRQLDIAINDRDAGGNTESQLIWAGNSGNPYSSRYYGTLLLSQ